MKVRIFGKNVKLREGSIAWWINGLMPLFALVAVVGGVCVLFAGLAL